MHKYLRSVGLSGYKTRKELADVIKEAIYHTDCRMNDSTDTLNVMELQFDKSFTSDINKDATGAGISVIGEWDLVSENLLIEHYSPYFMKLEKSTNGIIDVAPLVENEAYAGVFQEPCGNSIIFYIQNIIEVRKAYKEAGEKKLQYGKVYFNALSLEGEVLLPINISAPSIIHEGRRINKNAELREKYDLGDDDAGVELNYRESLLMEEIQRRIPEDDILSVVESTLLPVGVDCEIYELIGQIMNVSYLKNYITKENIVVLEVASAGYDIQVCINKEDIKGEPKIGRRFKGIIWLMGFVLDGNV